jgi:hypothetical protein
MPQVQVQNVTVETVTKGRNSYQVAVVSYDSKGATKEKKVMSFSNPAVFSVVKNLTAGQWIDVEYAKDDPYFNWAKVVVVDMAAPAPSQPTPGGAAPTAGKVLGNQYETRDERNMRQLHIVRQSAIKAAVDMLTPGAKAPLKVDDVTDMAQELVDWVYGAEEILGAANAAFQEIPGE